MSAGFWVGAALGVTLHEAAHAACARAFGLRVKRLHVSWFGVGIVREPGTAAVNAVIAVAGPAMNLLLAALSYRVSPEFALANLALGFSNLLPLPALDGWRVWQWVKTLI